MSSTIFSMRMDASIREKLEWEAKRIERPASYVVLEALKDYLQRKEDKRQAIIKAVNEADKGVFVSEEAVDTWVNSWGTDNELSIPEPDIFPAQK